MLQAFNFQLPSFVLNDDSRSPMVHTKNIAASYLMYWKGRKGLVHIPDLMANNHTSPSMKVSKYANYVDDKHLPATFRKEPIPDVDGHNHGNKVLSEEFESTMTNPLFSPLLADDLSKIPPTFISVGGNDVVRDDGLLYAQRLRSAAVPVTTSLVRDGFHAMFSFTRLQIGRDTLEGLATFMKSVKTNLA